MLFIKLSPQQTTAYSYTCLRLQKALDKMSNARKTLENFAGSSFDKAFAKCVYLFTSEALQFEHELEGQIYSLNCNDLYCNDEVVEEKAGSFSIKNLDTLCSYLEENYIELYQQLLKDKQLSRSLKTLMKNHLQMLLSSLTQLNLFKEVAAASIEYI